MTERLDDQQHADKLDEPEHHDPLLRHLTDWTRQVGEQPRERVAMGIAAAAREFHAKLKALPTSTRFTQSAGTASTFGEWWDKNWRHVSGIEVCRRADPAELRASAMEAWAAALATRSASEPMMPVAEVRKLLCERCRAGYALCGVKYEQHIVPSYSGDTYLDCRATEKLKAIMGVPDRKANP